MWVTLSVIQQCVITSWVTRARAGPRLRPHINVFVDGSPGDLATAQSNELQSVLNYRKALVELERVQSTTLSNLNITVISATGAVGTTSGGGQ